MSATPMMKQYQDAKAACPDALLLFRMGDFYELFLDDAKTAARVLNLALTSRDKGENPMPMAGFPYHQLESYLGKLIAAGLRVAICDQVEDPKEAKGLVRREVTRIVTAGTVTDDACSIPARATTWPPWPKGTTPSAWPGSSCRPVAFRPPVFPRRGWPTSWPASHPAECLLSEDLRAARDHAARRDHGHPRAPAWAFSLDTARDALVQHFGTAQPRRIWLRRRRRAGHPRRRRRAGLSGRNAKGLAGAHRPFGALSAGDTLEIDAATRRSLEITATLSRRAPRRVAAGRDGSHGHGDGLAAAGRLAGQSAWPTGTRSISGLDAVAELVADAPLSAALRRAVARRLRPRTTAGPRDHRPGQPARSQLHRPHAGRVAGDQGQDHRPPSPLLQRWKASSTCAPRSARGWSGAGRRLSAVEPRRRLHSRRLSRELDALRELTSGGKQWIAGYQAEESQRSGISKSQGRLQQGLWLLPRNHQRAQRQDSRPTTSASRRSRTPSATSRPS